MTDRPFTTALFLLRCVELGLSMSDLEELDMGMVVDMMTEKGNDDFEYKPIARKAEQSDFDRF